MLSRVSTKSSYKKGLDPSKKKIFFILGIIFIGIVFYGLTNLSKIRPTNVDKIPLKVETGDKPVVQVINITVNSEGQPLNIRKEYDGKSEKVGQVPDKTTLVAEEERDGWYRIKYNGKEGWIAKKYTLLVVAQTGTTTENKTANWPQFKGTGYTFKFPVTWSQRNYTTSDSLVWIAFSNTDLPLDAPKGAVIPIELKVYPIASKPSGGFRADPVAKKEIVKVSGVDATKYTYLSPETSTEINVFEFENGGNVYNFYDNGGYLEDLNSILSTFLFS